LEDDFVLDNLVLDVAVLVEDFDLVLDVAVLVEDFDLVEYFELD